MCLLWCLVPGECTASRQHSHACLQKKIKQPNEQAKRWTLDGQIEMQANKQTSCADLQMHTYTHVHAYEAQQRCTLLCYNPINDLSTVRNDAAGPVATCTTTSASHRTACTSGGPPTAVHATVADASKIVGTFGFFCCRYSSSP